MEYLDTYNEEMELVGKFPRKEVHEKGLWHKTIHCWMYDILGNIYFQIRSDKKTFYTTASGHVLAEETIKEAFGREIKEELGLDIDYEKAQLVEIVKWKMDKTNNDGTEFKDRAFANVYVYECSEDLNDFSFDKNEVAGVVKVKAIDAKKLFDNELENILATIYTEDNFVIRTEEKKVEINDFLVTTGETAAKKYGIVLNKIIELTEKGEIND